MLDSNPQMAIPHGTHFLLDLVRNNTEARTAQEFCNLVTGYGCVARLLIWIRCRIPSNDR